MDERCQLVAAHREEFGLNVCCAAMGVSKSSVAWRARSRVSPVDDETRSMIVRIIKSHPGYGWRRIKVELEEQLGHAVNHKRVKRLMKSANLGLARCLPRHRPSRLRQILDTKRGELNLVHGRELTPLNAVSTDFTEIRYGGGKKAWLMVIIDITSKVVLGWSVAKSRNRELALHCWDKTCETLGALGTTPAGMIVHSDLDAVYTSYDWIYTLILVGLARVSFSENGAKHNPWIESFWGRLKTELASRFTEAQDLTELYNVLDIELVYYNHQRRHSALGYITPAQFLADHAGMELPQPALKCQVPYQPEEETIWPF